MSFLTPLYLLGALAVVGPLVFHLIRRTTKGEVPFSSLIFLSRSPPRLTRRSRLDHLFLLFLRATALILLALAFSRPFLRQAASLTTGEDERSRVALLIDTSSSMRRGDLWARAKATAEGVIAGCRPGDQLAVFAFDASSRPLLGLEESAAMDPSRRQVVARALVHHLSPTWGATDLGQALIDVVGAIENVGDAGRKTSRMPRRIVLISDLQQGAHLDVLGGFEWPSDVELVLKTVAADGSNAGLQWLAGPAEGEPIAGAAVDLRVRVSNDPGATREAFELAWVDAREAGSPIPIYVPPGESRVVRVPPSPGASTMRSLRLRGDSQEFDNTLYLSVVPKEDATVLYVGPEAPDDPAGLLYYLNRVFEDTPRRSVKVEARTPAAPLAIEAGRPPALVVLAAETTPANVVSLRRYAEGGGTLLVVIAAPGRATTLSSLAGSATVGVEEAAVRGDVMLGEIAFDHPLFAPFAAPQFNDFTKIHYWKYRRLPAAALGEARVLARYEDGDPAVLETPLGKGRLVVMTSGWNPADSQLARSSKFVPLMSALLEGPDGRPNVGTNHLVHDRVPLPAEARAVRKPDGTTARLTPGNPAFSDTDTPGIYTIDMPGEPRSFAVNLDPAESKTTPLDVETLEQFGCLLSNPSRDKVEREALRQLQRAELEGRQKLWRLPIVAALGILIVETWLAGRLGRTRPTRAEVPAT